MTHMRPEPDKRVQASSPVWAAYAACGWALLFAAVHAYWACGGIFGCRRADP